MIGRRTEPTFSALANQEQLLPCAMLRFETRAIAGNKSPFVTSDRKSKKLKNLHKFQIKILLA